MEQILLKPSDLIGMLALSRSTVYSLLQSGEIASVRIGRAIRIPMSAVEGWIQNQLSANAALSSAD